MARFQRPRDEIGLELSNALVERDRIPLAKELLTSSGQKLILPTPTR